jgi:DNA-binding MarR family transcriptional regulator
MDRVIESAYMTETKRRVLEKRKAKGITPEQVFVKHSLHAVADVIHKLGSHAALVFLAILGTNGTVSEEEREAGFTVRNSFRDATQLGDRQFRRAVAVLAKAGYIQADTGHGRKPRIRLTPKGRRAIPGALPLVNPRSEVRHRAPPTTSAHP